MSLLQKADTLQYSASLFEIGPNGQIKSHTENNKVLSAKRILDIVGALAALMLFAPLMTVIYVGLLLSGGSPIFVQHRVGRNGGLFRCYKFRSMVKDANRVLSDYLEHNPAAREEWNRSFKLLRDPRITWFGQCLRRTSMDELPQLFNVLKGEMSLVGPRPIVPNEVEYYADKITDYCRCRPGMTGLWQVSGRNLVSYDRRVRLDAIYARKQSVRLDMIILLRTVKVVVSGAGAC
ncbi:MAG TPA: sugar transferase [Micropepsaceae bacterium]|nr:sugar transferase [Micropepsaceae bacterium]